MKKILSIIAAIGLTAATSSTLVSCSGEWVSANGNDISSLKEINAKLLQEKLQSSISSMNYEQTMNYLNSFSNDEVENLKVQLLGDNRTMIVIVKPKFGFTINESLILKLYVSKINAKDLETELQELIKGKTKEESLNVLNSFQNGEVDKLQSKVLDDNDTIIVMVNPKLGYVIDEVLVLKLSDNSISIDAKELQEKLENLINGKNKDEAMTALKNYSDEKVESLNPEYLENESVIAVKVNPKAGYNFNSFIILKISLTPIDVGQLQSELENLIKGKTVEESINILNAFNNEQVKTLNAEILNDQMINVTITPNKGFSVDQNIVLKIEQVEINLSQLRITLEDLIIGNGLEDAKNKLTNYQDNEVKKLEITVLDDQKTIIVSVIPNDGYHVTGTITLTIAAKAIDMNGLKEELSNGIKDKPRSEALEYLVNYSSDEVAHIKASDDPTTLKLNLKIIPNKGYVIGGPNKIELTLSELKLDIEQINKELVKKIDGMTRPDAINYLDNYYDDQIHKIVTNDELHFWWKIKVEIYPTIQYKIDGDNVTTLALDFHKVIQVDNLYYDLQRKGSYWVEGENLGGFVFLEFLDMEIYFENNPTKIYSLKVQVMSYEGKLRRLKNYDNIPIIDDSTNVFVTLHITKDISVKKQFIFTTILS